MSFVFTFVNYFHTRAFRDSILNAANKPRNSNPKYMKNEARSYEAKSQERLESTGTWRKNREQD